MPAAGFWVDSGHTGIGPLLAPGKVGSRFRPIRGAMGGPKSAQIGVPWVDWYPTYPKLVFDGWTLVPNLYTV